MISSFNFLVENKHLVWSMDLVLLMLHSGLYTIGHLMLEQNCAYYTELFELLQC